MNKTIRNASITFLAVAAVSLLGYGVALGYGGGGGGGGIVGLIDTNSAPLPGNAIVTTGSTGGSGQVLGAQAYNFTVNFGVGTRDEDVTQLQTILIADGYLNISAPTGYFGPLTKAAVIQYQEANNITPASGFVGPLTRAVLNQGSTPTASQEQNSILQNLADELNNALNMLKHLGA